MVQVVRVVRGDRVVRGGSVLHNSARHATTHTYERSGEASSLKKQTLNQRVLDLACR